LRVVCRSCFESLASILFSVSSSHSPSVGFFTGQTIFLPGPREIIGYFVKLLAIGV